MSKPNKQKKSVFKGRGENLHWQDKMKKTNNGIKDYMSLTLTVKHLKDN